MCFYKNRTCCQIAKLSVFLPIVQKENQLYFLYNERYKHLSGLCAVELKRYRLSHEL